MQPPAIAAPFTTAIVGIFKTASLPNIAMNYKIKYLMSSICFRLLVYFKSRPALNILSFKEQVIRQA